VNNLSRAQAKQAAGEHVFIRCQAHFQTTEVTLIRRVRAAVVRRSTPARLTSGCPAGFGNAALPCAPHGLVRPRIANDLSMD